MGILLTRRGRCLFGLLIAVAMAIFVHSEFFNARLSHDPRVNFVGTRPWQIVGLFIIIGVTSLTKGPLLGLVVAASTIGVYQLITFERPRALRYV